ncbi:ABC transporter permease [Acinetobacter larvae]|uniref:Transport permease protein n=1 Tax=Acinetobacter larvae TaxID=1789224 RepID=A0A1B2M1Z5_9GAMM|nr:ABC transporter permease [Acinetobacter larvae]AOA59214.1 polysialic acid transporter [Acinetobacter larvae]
MSAQNHNNLKKLPRLKPRNGLMVMYAAIRALFLRELQTRFGQYRLGYLWIFIEPMFNIGVLLILFGTIMKKTLPGIDYEIFLINGIIPFFMLRKGLTQAVSASDANKGLFAYRPVRPIDAVLARNILELFLSFCAYVFFTGLVLWFGYSMSFEAIPQLLGYWLSLFIFMLAASLVFMVLGSFSSELNKFLTILFLLLYFLSGIIYSIHIIPTQYQQYLLYNPLIHIFENMRHAVAPSYPLVQGISLGYFWTWTFITLLIGLLLYKRFERRLVRSK